jgi:NADPH-dependent curcumin reductase CurA
MAVNRQITLATRPVGYPRESDFELVEAPVPEPRHGQVLVRTLWLSLDPYQRGRMNAAKSYAPSVEIGEPIVGGAVGRVERSETPAFAAGDIVEGWLGWQDYALADGHGAAAGAVGSLVGQIAKIMGCRVVGTVGSDDKVGYVTGALGFDVGINYKTENVFEAVQRACPNGVDVYFDNVGGDVTEAVLQNLAAFARVVICGQISQYNKTEPDNAPRNLRFLLVKQARMEGFLVFRFAGRYDEGRRRLAQWIRDGTITYREDVVDGLENAPRAFIGLMKGSNFGKLLVKVADA